MGSNVSSVYSWNYLCIPTVLFLTPEALDYKTPLLRALQVMDDAATEVCKYFDKT
jgi:glutamine synthetase